MVVVYKTLFELKVLHQFYLTDADGETVFRYQLQQDRLNFLLQQFVRGRPGIDEMITYSVPPFLQKAFAGYRLRLVPTYSGCKLAMAVQEARLDDGTIVYRPFIPLSGDFNFIIFLHQTKEGLDRISNSRLQKTLPALYAFTNERRGGVARPFPVLAAAVSGFDSLYRYEQGELAAFGSNELRMFRGDVPGDQWQTVEGSGFVNENDRIAVPLRTTYSFGSGSQVKAAVFTLKDPSGQEVKTTSFQGDIPLNTVALNFEDAVQHTLAGAGTFASKLYTLEVAGDNNFSQQHELLFVDLPLNELAPLYGAVHLLPNVTDPAFNLVDSDGFLQTRIQPDGTRTAPPVFELRVMSRLAYWRYLNNAGKPLDSSTYTADFLSPEDGRLVSKLPRLSSATITLFQKESDHSLHYLPNPNPGELLRIEEGKQYLTIRVPESEMFPVVPM